MKRLFASFSLAFLLLATGCSGQENKITEQDKSYSPRINSKVHREYDENGNLRKFDSTYTYYYNSGGNSPDSLPYIFKKHFGDLSFFNDSTLFKDSFFDDPFLRDFFEHDRFYGNPFPNVHPGNDSTKQHVPRIVGPRDYMFDSDRFRQMFRYFDSLNKSILMNKDTEKFFKQEKTEKAKKMNARII